MGRPLDEAALVARARRGDDAAYGDLVRAYQDIAFRAAYLVTGSAADAEEAAQDGFLKAHRALRRFRRDAPFRPWLLSIVVNEARNRRRAAGARQRLTLRAVDDALSGGAAPSPESEALAAEEGRRLLEAVAALRDEDRIVVSCRHFLGLSEDETARVAGVPVGTVKSRLSRALARVRAQMEEAQTS